MIFTFLADARTDVWVHSADDGFNWGQAAPWLVALVALAFSIYQYYSTARVKRLEYLDGLARTAREDPYIKAAMLMLDWDVRTIELNGKRFVYSVEFLEHALWVHNAGTAVPPKIDGTHLAGFDDVEAAIRDAFDVFFGYLENMKYAVDLGVLTEDDVYSVPLQYYFDKLLEKNAWSNGAIFAYLHGYGFPKTALFLDNYRIRFGIQHAALSGEVRQELRSLFADEITQQDSKQYIG